MGEDGDFWFALKARAAALAGVLVHVTLWRAR